MIECPSQARLSVSAFIKCALRGACLLHFGLPFVIVRGHTLSLPNTSVELDVKLLKFGALFSQHLKMLWFAARSSNNLISGVLGSFDRYCRVGLIFAGAVRTMTDCKCFSVASSLDTLISDGFCSASKAMRSPMRRPTISNPRGVKSANTDFDPVFSTNRCPKRMLFLMGHVLKSNRGSTFSAD
jgi:hypothetical protein